MTKYYYRAALLKSVALRASDRGRCHVYIDETLYREITSYRVQVRGTNYSGRSWTRAD
jgi:hypothetical protein